MYLVCDNSSVLLGIQTFFHMNQKTYAMPTKHFQSHYIFSTSLKSCGNANEVEFLSVFSIFAIYHLHGVLEKAIQQTT
ncbi:hypothetical protein TNCV_2739811 [Trichonephila clavipes]|nr:hypothetical protein TNCV_2739811 [Trichonephila clavipes]